MSEIDPEVRIRTREAELAARVEQLEHELAEAKAALEAKPVVDRAQLFALTDTLPVLVSVIGRDQRYEFANKAYEGWFGTDNGPVAGRHALDVLGPEAYQRLLPYFERALAGERVSFEAEIPYKTAGTRNVFTTIAPRRSPDGQITGVVALVIDLSRRFVDEAALRESQRELQLVTDSVPVLICYVDAEERYRFVNKTYEDWFGHRREDLLGRAIREVIGEAAYEGVRDKIARALVGERFSFEQSMPYKDGGARHVNIDYIPRFDAGGRVEGYYALVQDISERKAADAALRASEARLSAVLESVSDGFYALDAEWRFTVFNTAAERYFGRTRGSVFGRRFGDIFPEAMSTEFETRFARIMAGGAPESFEIESRAVPGRVVEMRAARKAIGGIAVSFTDITERRRAEARLRESEDHYRHAVELDPQTTWTSAPDGQLDQVNSRWMEWTGTSGLGSSYADGLHEEDRQRTFDVWGHSVATGEPYDIEHRVKMRDGSYRWMHSRAYPRRDEAGRIVKWYGTTEDVHDRKTVELALDEALARAEAQAAERAAILGQLAEGVIVTDAEGNITFVNEAAARIHGMSRLHVGAPDYAQTYGLFTEDGEPYPSLDLPLARAVRGETVTDARWLIRRPDAEVLAVGSARPVFGPDGAQIGAVLTLRDESAREMAEAAVRESEAHLAALVGQTAAGLAETDLDGRFVNVNDRYCEIVGRSRDELLKLRMHDITHPDDLPGNIAPFRRMVEAGEPFEIEKRYVRPDGSAVWVSNSVSLIRRVGRRPASVVAITIEVTARKRAEEAVRASEERLRLATDGAGMGTWDYDFASGRGLWSVSAFAVLGYAPTPDGSWTFDMWRDAVHPDDLARVRAAAADAKVGGDAYSVEYRIRRADDGAERWIHAFGHYVYGEAGEPVRYVGVFFDITERKVAEARLRESDARLRALTDNLPVAMVYQVETSRDMTERRYTYVSANCERLTGVPLDVALGDPAAFLRTFDPDEWPRVFAAEQEAARELRTLDVEFAGRGPDERPRRFHVISHPRELPDGRLVWDGLLLDVTARREAEAAIRESEARFRLIADSAPVPMWVTRLDRKREFVNRAYVDFLGVSYDEAVDFDWRTVIHPDDAPRIYQEQVEKEASLRPFTLEARYRDASGEWRWLRSESQPRWGSDGEHTGFIGAAYDVTIAKEAEIALEAEVAERTAELERTWRLSQDLLVVVEPDGVLAAVNEAWTTALGWNAREVIGVTFMELAHPDDVSAAFDTFRATFETPLTVPYEFRLRHKDGSYRWLAWTAAFEAGRVFANGRDVTLERERQAELTAAQEQLRQSQKMEAVGQLTGGVAHDFNNLLTPIMGSLDMLRRRLTADERAQRTIDLALQATSRAATLVQRLLAFARRQDLQARSVDVADLLVGIEDLIARSLGSGVKVMIDVPDALPPAHIDPNQLELAILNLSINARDAMPGGGTLTIGARETEVSKGEPDLKPGRYVRVSVADTGIGMDAETLRRAIEPFFSTKGVGKGTGLGLSMAHGLAAQLGGALRLSSTPGIGTTAELWLPVAAEPARSDAIADIAPAKAERAAAILLVDDEDLVRAGTADMLTDLGYRVVEAASGAEAVERLRAGPRPDLLVTDYLMPQMNGTDLAAAVRRDHPGLPILMISGYTNLETGDADLPRLMKPFRQEQLAAKVATLLKPRSS